MPGGFDRYFSDARQQQRQQPQAVPSHSCNVGPDFRRKVDSLIFGALGATPQQQTIEYAKYKLTELFHRTRRAPGNEVEHLSCLLGVYLQAYDRLDDQLLTRYPPTLEPASKSNARPKKPKPPPEAAILFADAEPDLTGV